MKQVTVTAFIVLCVCCVGTLLAQTGSSAQKATRSSVPPSSAPADTDKTASPQATNPNPSLTHWYEDAAKVGLLATVLSVFATIFYTVLTAVIVSYMKRQTLLQKAVNEMQVFEMILQRLEATRGARALIRDYVKKGEIAIPPPSPVLEAVDSVCREFDFLGFVDRRGLVNQALVDEFYSVPFVLLYEQLLGGYADYVRDESRRGHTHFWELVQFYQRVRHVPLHHPGRPPGAADWPANPRMKA